MEGCFEWVCPECREPLVEVSSGALRCPVHDLSFQRQGGVLRLLTEERLARYRRFLEEYRTIRRHEGRGATDARAYRALPYTDHSGRHRAEWRIRARSFDGLLQNVVNPLAAGAGRLRVIDLGAGNGWMSRRLALLGHSVAAVDILTDDGDGLGAHRLSEKHFDAVQGEFDRLPLGDACVDLVVFNGAFHYSADPVATLEETLRVLRPGGAVAILDTPLYHDGESGRRMVEERRSAFLERHGFASDSIPSCGYLSFASLEAIGQSVGLCWKVDRPFYGLRWTFRPLWATVRRRREPATFAVVWAHKTGDPSIGLR